MNQRVSDEHLAYLANWVNGGETALDADDSARIIEDLQGARAENTIMREALERLAKLPPIAVSVDKWAARAYRTMEIARKALAKIEGGE